MSRCKVSLLAICLFWLWPAFAAAQNLPLLNMGYSGAGIGSDLLKVIERAGLWRRHGIEVRTIYLSSGSLMAQTMSSGDIGVAGFDTPAMLNLAVAGTNLKVVAVPMPRQCAFLYADSYSKGQMSESEVQQVAVSNCNRKLTELGPLGENYNVNCRCQVVVSNEVYVVPRDTLPTDSYGPVSIFYRDNSGNVARLNGLGFPLWTTAGEYQTIR
jgi:hypothetical protein